MSWSSPPRRGGPGGADIPVALQIRELTSVGAREVEALTDVLIDCVEGRASVSFMHPMTRAKAEAFWRGVAAGVARGGRVVLVAEDEAGAIVGTVQVILNLLENQPHRGEVAKMLVRRQARRRGVGAALPAAAEDRARRAGRTLLVLDTVTGGDGERLYARHGWQRCGKIPNYALFPDGRPCATTVFFKVLDGVPTGGPAEPRTKTAAGRAGVDGNLPRKRGRHAQ